MVAGFVDLLVSFGIRILLVLLFVDFSSFIVAVLGVCLFTSLLLVFARIFVSMFAVLSVNPTAIPGGRRTTSREFVRVGFVFLLSVLFF
jgi:hypothetical protein